MEQINFGFLWLGSRSDKERGVDRIKWLVLKKSKIWLIKYNEV